VIEEVRIFAEADARPSARAGNSLAVRRTATIDCAMGVQVGFHGGSRRFRSRPGLLLAPDRLQTSSRYR
jgi:hypothetical protein